MPVPVSVSLLSARVGTSGRAGDVGGLDPWRVGPVGRGCVDGIDAAGPELDAGGGATPEPGAPSGEATGSGVCRSDRLNLSR